MPTLDTVTGGDICITAKPVANCLPGSEAKKDIDKDENENQSEKKPKEDEKRLTIDPIILVRKSDSHASSLKAAGYAIDVGLSHQRLVPSFQTWEKTTLARIKGAKQRRLDNRPNDLHDIIIWYQSTMDRFRQERARRLVKIREQGDEAARAWASKRGGGDEVDDED
jgi:hypothetical protein